MLSRILIFVFIVMTTSTFAQIPPIEAGVPQTLAKWRAANYSDVRYKLNLTLEKGAPLMKGEIEIRVKLTDEGAKNDLILDWRTTQFANDKDKPFADVVEVNKSLPLNASIKLEHILIPPRNLKIGENVVKINFASPIKTSGAAITRYVDKEDGAEYVYSLFVPSDASTAFPLFDQPDLKAQFDLNVKAPDNWTVISNTALSIVQKLPGSHTEDARKKLRETSFEITKPISTYVFAFAAGEFAEFEDPKKETISFESTEDIAKNNGLITRIYSGVPKIYVRKSQAEKFKQHKKEVFRLNREGVNFLETYFDYKFPFPKYDLVLIPEFPFGGMEHAGATFLRESSVIFPTEPTKNDYVSRANVIFHEAAHQWFGDTVTMKWFDDLWLKEGFAEFMAYKTLEKVMPEYNAWKIFYERNKQAAYLTDSTKGTTPIYQEILNLSAAKSAYGNIVYRKAPSFLRQAEFYLGEDKFQTAVRAFLKKHEFANAEWTDLVKEFEMASKQDLKDWANVWVKQRGVPIIRANRNESNGNNARTSYVLKQKDILNQEKSTREIWKLSYKILESYKDGEKQIKQHNPPILDSDTAVFTIDNFHENSVSNNTERVNKELNYIFPNYQDYGYCIFLLDERSRDYVLKNIQNEPDDFLRSMMWGTLWDSVREAELAPREYVELAIKNIGTEKDELTIQTILGRVSTAMNYYMSEPPASAGGSSVNLQTSQSKANPPADAGGSDLAQKLETLLIEKMQNAPTLGQRITFYRAFLNIASTDKAKQTLKDILSGKFEIKDLKLKTKDRFDIATKLLIIGDKDATNLLAELEKTETSDEAKRYAYAAKAGIATAENKQKFFNDFVGNKEISESYIETAFVPFNSSRHADLTLPFLEKALVELPNLKRNRKIFFVNGWLSAFIGGQKSERALEIVNKFLTDNPNLDRDLRLKVLEVSDNLERAVKIRAKYK